MVQNTFHGSQSKQFLYLKLNDFCETVGTRSDYQLFDNEEARLLIREGQNFILLNAPISLNMQLKLFLID